MLLRCIGDGARINSSFLFVAEEQSTGQMHCASSMLLLKHIWVLPFTVVIQIELP
jgi:hypothetical protein